MRKTLEYDLEIWISCYHEAGHAVMADLMDFCEIEIFVKDTISDDGEKSGGVTYCFATPSIDKNLPPMTIRQAMFYLGGFAAECGFLGKSHNLQKVLTHSSEDIEIVDELLENHSDSEQDQVYNDVLRIIQDKKIPRQMTRKIAWVLYRHNKHLSSKEIMIILGHRTRICRLKRKLIQLRYKIKKQLQKLIK